MQNPLTNKLNTERFILSSLLIFNFFFPSFNSLTDQTGHFGFKIYSVLIFSICLLSIFIIKKPSININIGTYLVLFLGQLLIIGLNGVRNRDLSLADVIEVYRPISCFLFAYLGYAIASVFNSRVYLTYITNKISNFLFIIIVFWIIIFFINNDVTDAIWNLYGKQSLIDARRISGTFVNPYDYVYAASFVILFSYLKFIKSGNIFNIIVVFLTAFSILASQSKAGVILFAFSIAFVFLFSSRVIGNFSKNQRIRNLFLPTLSIVLISYVVVIYYDYFSYVLGGLKNILTGTDTSTNIRLNQIYAAIDAWSSSVSNIFVGQGSNKSSDARYENLLFLYLVRYGLFGVLLILLLILVPAFIGIKSAIKRKDEHLFIISSWIFLAAIAGLANNTIDQMRISFMFFFLLGTVISVTRLSDNTMNGGSKGR